MAEQSVDSAIGTEPPRGKPYALVVLLQLYWFIRLRWIFAGVSFLVLAVERLALPMVERPWQLWVAVMSVAGVNVLWAWISRVFNRQLEVSERELESTIRSGQLFASAQISVDLALLTWILSLTGGVENPMSLFYLFHVGITGLLLRTWQAAIQSCWAALLYATMAIGQMMGWLPYYPFLPHLGASGSLHADPHFVGVALTVVLVAIFGTLYFMDRIGRVLDRREALLVEANTALHKSQQAIRDLQSRRSRFMQTAAHQLKSPLAMVQTLSNLIRDGIVTDEQDIRNVCDKIVRRSREGIGQVTELLALARVQEADPRRHRESLADVAFVVAELCRKHASVAQDKRQQFKWEIPEGDALEVRVNQADLTDCVTNLIENAIKYTPEEGDVWVRVVDGKSVPEGALPCPPKDESGTDCRDQGSFVYVQVQDSGMGIEESVLRPRDGSAPGDSLFDAFRRGGRALAAGIPGTGLGLSIVREVVEQAGGFIHVYSRENKGSTFTVALPARTAREGALIRDTRSSHIIVERDGEEGD